MGRKWGGAKSVRGNLCADENVLGLDCVSIHTLAVRSARVL